MNKQKINTFGDVDPADQKLFDMSRKMKMANDKKYKFDKFTLHRGIVPSSKVDHKVSTFNILERSKSFSKS